tara:strand:+ start:1334 stop:1906 length:573 start_codon:yes stop_codon:yes gene_type:complete
MSKSQDNNYLSKEDRANLLDPNRSKIAKQNAVIPGGPENNNPMNVTDNASPEIKAASIYGDYAQNYKKSMGTYAVNPQGIPPSGLQQNNPMGQLLNGQTPYGQQNQLNINDLLIPDAMEAARLAENAQKYGLNVGAMGMIGMPAQPAPGAFPPAFPGSNGEPLMKPQNSMSAMTPGSSKVTFPRKTNKRA